MQKFEYKVEFFDKQEDFDLIVKLNEFGQEGWELVSIESTMDGYCWYFKRKVQPHQPVPEGWKNKITGHFLTDVICATDCKYCHQDIFHWCKDRGGEWSKILHKGRIHEFMKMPHFNAANYVDFQRTLRQ